MAEVGDDDERTIKRAKTEEAPVVVADAKKIEDTAAVPKPSGFGGGFGSGFGGGFGGVKAAGSFGAVSSAAAGSSPWLVKPAGGAPAFVNPTLGKPSASFTFTGFGTTAAPSAAATAFGQGKPAPFALAPVAAPAKPGNGEGGDSGDEDEGGEESLEGEEAFGGLAGATPEYKVDGVVLKEDTGRHVTGEEAEAVRFSLARAKLYKLLKKEPKEATKDAHAPPAPATAADSNTNSNTAASGAAPADEPTAGANAGSGGMAAVAAAAVDKASPPGVLGAVLTEWREAGLGTLKVLVPKVGEGRGRLVMRREKTEALILNVSLKGMAAVGSATLSGDKAVKFTVLALAEADHKDEKAAAADQAAPPDDKASPSKGDSSAEESGVAPKLVPCTFLLKTKTKDEAVGFLAAIDACLKASSADQ